VKQFCCGAWEIRNYVMVILVQRFFTLLLRFVICHNKIYIYGKCTKITCGKYGEHGKKMRDTEKRRKRMTESQRERINSNILKINEI